MVCDKVIRLSSKIYFLNKILDSENKITSGRDDDVTEENISDHAKDKDDAVDCKKYPSEKKSVNIYTIAIRNLSVKYFVFKLMNGRSWNKLNMLYSLMYT